MYVPTELFGKKNLLNNSYVVLIFIFIIILFYLIYAVWNDSFPFTKRITKITYLPEEDASVDLYMEPIEINRTLDGNILYGENFRIFYKYDYIITVNDIEKYDKMGSYVWFKDNKKTGTKLNLIIPVTSVYHYYNNKSDDVKIIILRTIGVSNLTPTDTTSSSLIVTEKIIKLNESKVIVGTYDINSEIIYHEEIFT